MNILYLKLFLVILAGSCVQACVGFGLPIVAMIFLVQWFDFSTSVALCQITGLFGVSYIVIKYFSKIRWKILIPFLVPALLIGLFCVYYSLALNTTLLKILLGGFLFFLALFLFFVSNKFNIKANNLSGIITGVISGIFNGFFGIGGPTVALYMLPAIQERQPYIATVQFYFLLAGITSLAIRLEKGALNAGYLGYVGISIIAMLIGTITGDFFMNKISTNIMKKIVLGFVGISGLIIIIQQI
ncbi:MAG: sulfite exporter TauE/SafE family protein [Sphaerochaetaceae bacterium]